ncbi:HEAT repeat domain-containing protein [Limnoglobus roseus]|uniref:HEAT repeat domain-containing protein n=1 Tax=Limnoglobus roseus TaxID=2598579 RepID=A0A5C1ALU0_9BACT|nr:HEAT repeat domain-containing protein [Limnoglobus roseus]QEL19535.1 HEAT repeat domain-containing protein [Limnoglobus roseus]
MSHRLFRLLLAILFLTPAMSRAADDPSFNGRTLTEWMAVLKDDSLVRKRRAAVVSLGQMMSGNAEAQTKAIPALARALKNDSNAALRGQVANLLGQQPVEVAAQFLPDMAEALRNEKDADVRKEISLAVGHYGKLSASVVLPLIDVLKDTAAPARAAAADALGRIGKDARRAAPTLVPLAADADRAVQYAAVFALGRIDPDDSESASIAILAVLEKEMTRGPKAATLGAGIGGFTGATARDMEMATAAIVSLGLLGEKSPDVVKAVAKFLPDADPELRQLAALTLGKFGIIGRVASAELRKAFEQDADKLVRAYALNSLCSSYGAEAKELIPALAARLKADDDYEVRVAIAQQLGGMGPSGKDAIPALREARRDSQLKVREAAAFAIRQIEKPIEKPVEKAKP